MAYRFSQEQVDVGNTILSVGRSMGANDFQMRAAFAAGWVESRLRNLNYGDRDSLGVFQQRPSQGWGTPAQIMNVAYAAGKFFETAMRVSQSGTPGQLAQRVQRSAFPNRYDEQLATSDELLARLSGGGTQTVSPAAALSGSNSPTGDTIAKYAMPLIGAVLLFLVIDNDG